jgi:hypothetical protein
MVSKDATMTPLVDFAFLKHQLFAFVAFVFILSGRAWYSITAAIIQIGKYLAR